jgi:hypothetical protein
MRRRSKSGVSSIKLFFLFVFCFILYLVYNTVMDTISEVKKREASNFSNIYSIYDAPQIAK